MPMRQAPVPGLTHLCLPSSLQARRRRLQPRPRTNTRNHAGGIPPQAVPAERRCHTPPRDWRRASTAEAPRSRPPQTADRFRRVPDGTCGCTRESWRGKRLTSGPPSLRSGLVRIRCGPWPGGAGRGRGVGLCGMRAQASRLRRGSRCDRCRRISSRVHCFGVTWSCQRGHRRASRCCAACGATGFEPVRALLRGFAQLKQRTTFDMLVEAQRRTSTPHRARLARSRTESVRSMNGRAFATEREQRLLREIAGISDRVHELRREGAVGQGVQIKALELESRAKWTEVRRLRASVNEGPPPPGDGMLYR